MSDLKQVLENYREFLLTIPDDMDWKTVSNALAKETRKERRNRTFRQNVNKVDYGWIDAFQAKLQKANQVKLNILDYIYRPSQTEHDLSFKVSNSKVLKDWLLFDKKENPKSGVYCIGDFYVGKSANIRTRLTGHIKYAINPHKAPSSQALYKRMFDYMFNGVLIPVTVVSDDETKEAFFIEYFKRSGYKLLNTAAGEGLAQ